VKVADSANNRLSIAVSHEVGRWLGMSANTVGAVAVGDASVLPNTVAVVVEGPIVSRAAGRVTLAALLEGIVRRGLLVMS